MAKKSESLILLKQKMGMTLSDAQKLAITEKYGDAEIEDDYHDDVVNLALPNYAKNQRKSIMDEFDSTLDKSKIREKIGGIDANACWFGEKEREINE